MFDNCQYFLTITIKIMESLRNYCISITITSKFESSNYRAKYTYYNKNFK